MIHFIAIVSWPMKAAWILYVGNLKCVGLIYQQTFVDTYSKVAHCKPYVTKTPITAADLLNDRILPFYDSQGVSMLRILTNSSEPILCILATCRLFNVANSQP